MRGWSNEVEILRDGAGMAPSSVRCITSTHCLRPPPLHSAAMAAITALSAVRSFSCTKCAEILVCMTNSALPRSTAFGIKFANMRNSNGVHQYTTQCCLQSINPTAVSTCLWLCSFNIMLYVLTIPFASGEDTGMHAHAAAWRLYLLHIQCMLFAAAHALKWVMLSSKSACVGVVLKTCALNF